MSWDIVGMGAVCGIGGTPQEVFGALCEGRDALAGLRAFDVERYRARQAYEIDDRAPGGRDEPFRATRWLHTAVAQALADAGMGTDLSEVPVLVGTTLREQRSVELWWRGGDAPDPDALHFGGMLARDFGARHAYTVANACAAALYALGMAADMIALGQADTVVVAGADAIAESAFGALDRVQNETPDALRPFDVSHRGMLMGEGAVAVVLTRDGSGAPQVHARLRGVGMSCDARHPTAPDPAGIVLALDDAYRRSGVGPRDIDLVMLHGSGTPANDSTEAGVLAGLLGRAGASPLLTAIKSMTGHTLGGSGLLSLVVAALSFRHGLVPPVLGLVEPIEEAAGLRLVQGGAAAADVRTAQVDAFGFGGINAVAIVEAVR